MDEGWYFLLYVVDDEGNPVDAKNITAVASKKYRCRQTKVTLISNEKRRSNKK